MNEKVIVKGKVSKAANIPAIISAIIAVWLLILCSWVGDFWAFLNVGVPLLILSVIFWYMMSRCEIIVTDKRVYGKATFGRQVNLPFDMISAVGTGAFKAIAVATSSGKIKFWCIANQKEIFDAITKILNERQIKPALSTNIMQETPQSNADELKKYKDLLDSGVITQEEFEAAKKNLLGL